MQRSARSRPRDVEPAWKKVLEENVYFLQENLMLTESIYAYFIQEKILSLEMVDKIKSSSDSDHGRTIELVRCLKKRGDDCFDRFIGVLHATENGFVADRLEQSMQPSRQSYSSDEAEILLQARDRQIHDLEERLAAKDRRIKELENVNENLKKRTAESLMLLREEMRNSDRYRKSLYDELGNVGNMEEEINEKDVQLKEVNDKVEELQSRIDSLEGELNDVKEDLQTKEDELNVVRDKERRIKRKLGLNEDASEQEIMEHLQSTLHSRSEMKRAQDELGNVTREKMTLDGRITTLTHEKDNLQFEIRQKQLEIERMRRNNLGSAASRPKRRPPYTLTQPGLQRQSRPMARIDVSGLPQMPESVAIMPPITTRSNLFTARPPTAAAASQKPHLPMLPRRNTFVTFEERETKYCVICRKNYYLKSECRIHVEPMRSGRFTCCGADANVKYVGCKIVNHMYIYFTGVGNEYVFYDERGRQLDFKDQ